MNEIQVDLRLEDDFAGIDLQGDVTGAGEQKIVTVFEKALSQKSNCIILNFEKVNYINSAGMSVIIRLLTEAQDKDIKLSAVGLSSHFQKIFEMVGLSKYVPHFANEDEARQNCS